MCSENQHYVTHSGLILNFCNYFYNNISPWGLKKTGSGAARVTNARQLHYKPNCARSKNVIYIHPGFSANGERFVINDNFNCFVAQVFEYKSGIRNSCLYANAPKFHFK
jgi:hypothetical protein